MKYFVISDIHGFYKEMIKVLRQVGYKKTDPNHTLIVCGDIFDRGPDAVKIYKFLKSIPKDRRVLIRGNHEYLLKEAVERGYFESHDRHNKTNDTVRQFIEHYYPGVYEKTQYPLSIFKNIGVLDWIFGDEWANYFELGDYIFVHSWIPVDTGDLPHITMAWSYDDFKPRDDWRDCVEYEWEEATWGCPWKMYKAGLVPEGKTIVCGHWHTSDFRKGLDGADQDCNDNTLYIGEHIVGLDACTALSGFCNVFTFEN